MGSDDDILRIFYFQGRKNFGDILTPVLVRRIFHKQVIDTRYIENANFIGCGSILERLKNLDEYQALTVWGSGFMYDGIRKDYPNVDFLAVRGKLSAKRIQNFHGVIGDPGLLVNQIAPVEKKIYDVGFVPHFVDRDLASTKYISRLPGVRYINICMEPRHFLRELVKCRYVISSSLHGLIAAESLGIPNLHVLLSRNVYGDNYKFRDYYSAFGFDHRYADLQNTRLHPRYLNTNHIIATIDQNYRKPANLKEIQDNLMSVFKEKYG